MPHLSPVSIDKLSKPIGDGILLTIKVSPKSHRDGIKGIVELPCGRLGLVIRVSPPAVDGAANEAVVGLLAKFFGASRNCVKIRSGTTGRIKTAGVRGNHLALKTVLVESFEAHSR